MQDADCVSVATLQASFGFTLSARAAHVLHTDVNVILHALRRLVHMLLLRGHDAGRYVCVYLLAK